MSRLSRVTTADVNSVHPYHSMETVQWRQGKYDTPNTDSVLIEMAKCPNVINKICCQA